MAEQLTIAQSAEFQGEDWWKWSVWLAGDADELDGIDYVEWRLHPTFPNPIRKIDDRANNFRLDTGGWGVFPIVARVKMKDGKQIQLRHYLELNYPDGTPNKA